MNKNQSLYIDVYADSTGLFTEEFLNHLDINMITLEISREIAFNFFKEFFLNDFKTEEDLSDEAFFEDWLDEYTCDDTEGLYQYVVKNMCGIAPIIATIG